MKYVLMVIMAFLLIGATQDTVVKNTTRYEKSNLVKNKLQRIQEKKTVVKTDSTLSSVTTTTKTDSVKVEESKTNAPRKEELTIIEFAALLIVILVFALVVGAIIAIIKWIVK